MQNAVADAEHQQRKRLNQKNPKSDKTKVTIKSTKHSPFFSKRCQLTVQGIAFFGMSGLGTTATVGFLGKLARVA